MPLSPTPLFYNVGDNFEVDDVPVVIDGLPTTDSFIFWNAASMPPFGASGGGTYSGYNYITEDDVTITITISQTPLPVTWTMLIAGFAGLGFFAYRGTKNRSAAVA
jgi:hypothetical protein